MFEFIEDTSFWNERATDYNEILECNSSLFSREHYSKR